MSTEHAAESARSGDPTREVGRTIGYCTNVHAGATLRSTRANLATHATAVRARLGADHPLGLGLWLSAAAARELVERREVDDLGRWLTDEGLTVFTLNGFPFGDFHSGRVKRLVYHPDWSTPERLAYTRDLARLFAALLPEGGDGSISTLPIGWAAALRADETALIAAGEHLIVLAHDLAALEDRTGRHVHVDLEPEPGCLLQTSDDVTRFFRERLLTSPHADTVRRHIGVCHDVCHAAVMFEDQAAMFDAYDEAGISVGKIQVSSAPRVRFDDMTDADRRDALRELALFAEDRYLHQTTIRTTPPSAPRFHEDLPDAIASVAPGAAPSGEWRTHFHVPIFLETIGRLETTRNEIDRLVELAAARPELRHFEIETYAWGVLPERHRRESMSADIAAEIEWFTARLESGRGA